MHITIWITFSVSSFSPVRCDFPDCVPNHVHARDWGARKAPVVLWMGVWRRVGSSHFPNRCSHTATYWQRERGDLLPGKNLHKLWQWYTSIDMIYFTMIIRLMCEKWWFEYVIERLMIRAGNLKKNHDYLQPFLFDFICPKTVHE